MSFVQSNYHTWLPQFEQLLHHVKSLPIWQQMTDTVEDSPWHREANVAVHTQLVIDQAFIFCQEYLLYPEDAKCVVVANLFHDFGKPASEQIKTNEQGTIYRSYAGHETVSARLFEQFYVDNYNTLFADWLTPEEAHKITFLIEHHLPYKVTDKRKREMYGRAIDDMFISRNTFYAMIKADTWGRISDDMDAKKQAVEQWIVEFEEMCRTRLGAMGPSRMQPRVVFLVGPSGAGKSTICKYYQVTGYVHYSWDDLRIQFFKDYIEREFQAAEDTELWETIIDKKLAYEKDPQLLYGDAFTYCNMDENTAAVSQYFIDSFRSLLDQKVNIVVDNTNLSRKRRTGLLQLAWQKKYWPIAVYKQTSLKMLYQRAQQRTDKKVPFGVIESQFNSVQVPFVGEFGEVVIDKSNFNH